MQSASMCLLSVLLLFLYTHFTHSFTHTLLFLCHNPLPCNFLMRLIFVKHVSLHSCIAFVFFQCSDESEQKKGGCCHSKISIFPPCNRNREGSIVFNHHDLERIPSNNDISETSFRLVERLGR